MLHEIHRHIGGHKMRRSIGFVLLLLQQFLFGRLCGLDVADFRLDAQIHLRYAVEHLVRQHLLGSMRRTDAQMVGQRQQGRLLRRHVLERVRFVVVVVAVCVGLGALFALAQLVLDVSVDCIGL